MWKPLKRIGRKALCHSGKGATLIEVVIAVVVLGVMVAAIPPVMVMVSNAQFRQNEMKIAENLTQSQFEYIKAQPYTPADEWGNGLLPYLPVARPSGYGLYINAEPIYPGNLTSSFPDDYGVQRITVTVFGWRVDSNDYTKYILETTDYKIDRWLEISGYYVED